MLALAAVRRKTLPPLRRPPAIAEALYMVHGGGHSLPSRNARRRFGGSSRRTEMHDRLQPRRRAARAAGGVDGTSRRGVGRCREAPPNGRPRARPPLSAPPAGGVL